MVSTFQGLEVAKRALNAQQTALYTTSHNISNANTEGYTRQRVNFEQVSSLAPTRFPGGTKSSVGSGVQPGSIQRIRDQFLDVQYRKENSKHSYFDTKATALRQLEGIMNEPTEEGLAFSLEQFFNSLQDLGVNPDDAGTRAVVSQRGQAVADSFQYIASSLEDVRGDLKNQIDVTTTEMNSIIDQINNVNREIGGIEPHGQVPNDLYDERDRLIDRLSNIADISVSYQKSSGQPSPVAEGIATVTLNNVGQEVTLVDGATHSVNHLSISYTDENNVEQFTFTDANGTTIEIAPSDFNTNGNLRGLMEMSGFIDADGEIVGQFNAMRDSLDEMITAYANAFNEVHTAGVDLEGEEGIPFFIFDTDDPTGSIVVNPAIVNNPNLIAASQNGDSGDGSNANDLADVLNNQNVGLGNRTSVKSYYQSVIGNMGVAAQEANRMKDNSAVLRQQVEENRASTSAVSLDEEMTNLIKFQHAYNAAARSMTSVDEMLDQIINRMGLVGR
ncbi:flagellar hook-associated protein FlgK [Natronobacillus azotifigens]|uniref:Flagellar hook-associated protein 1 n=1 Tax=Natronobacillus azotifigens TaxID=472978 RepID=A0A9J6R9S8_9BACI|nr:flagellar hook-associated protein FlgK [Natronobacillus azotifigens]